MKNLSFIVFFALAFKVHAQFIPKVNFNTRGSIQINLKGGDKKNGATGDKPKDNERYKLGYVSNSDFTGLDTANLYKVAGNFLVDIGSDKKKYPVGWGPQWNLIGRWGQSTYELTNFLQNRRQMQGPGTLQIAQFEGKAYIYISNFLQCSCAAPLLMDNENVVINAQPKVFFASEFRKILSDGRVTDQPCKSAAGGYYDDDGFQLKLTLSVDDAKTIHAAAIVESLTRRSNLINNDGTNVTYRWTNNNILIPNNISPEAAYATIEQNKKNAAEAAARKAAEEKRQRDETLAFEESIKNSFKKVAATQANYPEFNLEFIKVENTSTYIPGSHSYHTEEYIAGMTYDGNGAGTPVRATRQVEDNKPGYYEKHTYEKNISNKPIIIKGITKRISPSGTVYYQDASIKLEAEGKIEQVFVIEEFYDSKAAEVGSTHYYRKKLVVI